MLEVNVCGQAFTNWITVIRQKKSQLHADDTFLGLRDNKERSTQIRSMLASNKWKITNWQIEANSRLSHIKIYDAFEQKLAANDFTQFDD